MKQEWTYSWEAVPGDGVVMETFPTREEAREAMTKKLRESFALNVVTDALRNEAEADCHTLADFLEEKVFTLVYPFEEDEIPDLDLPDRCDGILDRDHMEWGYAWGECLQVYIHRDDLDGCTVNFWLDQPKKGRTVTMLSMTLTPRTLWGTSAYPVMILKQLDETPKTQTRIRQEIRKHYGCTIDRKAIGRHMELLQALDYGIRHDQRGYFIPQSSEPITAMDKNLIVDCIRAYPHMDENLKQKLLRKVQLLHTAETWQDHG